MYFHCFRGVWLGFKSLKAWLGFVSLKAWSGFKSLKASLRLGFSRRERTFKEEIRSEKSEPR